MNIRTFNTLNWVHVINELNSEKIGFYFSFFLHLILLIFAIGLPTFFQPNPINIPYVIPIEIINISDTTSMPKEIQQPQEEKIVKEIINKNTKTKKFNAAEPELIKEVEIKTKPQKDTDDSKIVKEKVKIDEKIEKTVELNNQQKIIEKENFETLPSKKIKPKIKPKTTKIESIDQESSDIIVKTKPKTQLNFNIASMLKDLRNEEKSIQNKQNENNKIQNEKILNKKEKETNENFQLSIREIDLLVQQLSMCWSAPAGAVIKKGMVVKISAKIKANGQVLHDSIRIIDTNIPQTNPFYGPITESAMRTLLNPECNPLRLPKDKYDLWKNLTINFDHSIMKGYQ